MASPSESELQALFDDARAAWPAVTLPFAEFAALFDSDDAAPAQARDLYLARACANGDAPALREFEQHFLGATYDAIARIDRSVDFIAEVQQHLRERLLVGAGAKIKAYRGSGPLAGWVRTAAVRGALNLRRAGAARPGSGPGSGSAEHELGGLLDDPEIAVVKQRCSAELSEALARAVDALSPEERVLLRFYYVDRLTLAKIAALQKLGVGTVFRRLEATTREVRAAVRAELAGKLRLSTESLDSLIREAQHDIELNLSQLLGRK
jgi:RNA polymerase sigma-70 factor (ECF subfamily)